MSRKRKKWMDNFFSGDDPPIDWSKVRAGGASDIGFRKAPRLKVDPPDRTPGGDWHQLITEEEVRRARK